MPVFELKKRLLQIQFYLATDTQAPAEGEGLTSESSTARQTAITLDDDDDDDCVTLVAAPDQKAVPFSCFQVLCGFLSLC